MYFTRGSGTHLRARYHPIAHGGTMVCTVLLQGLGSRARIRWVDLVTRPIRTPCGSAASARPRRSSPSIAPVPCGAHA